MWRLAQAYEVAGDMNNFFNPLRDLNRVKIRVESERRTRFRELFEEAKARGADSFNAHKLAETVLNQLMEPVSIECDLPYTFIDSANLQSTFQETTRYELMPEISPGQVQIKQELTEQGWTHVEAPPAEEEARLQ